MAYQLSVLRCPSGRYHFVGSVPGVLAYTHKDGSPATGEEISDDLRLPSSYRRLKGRTWESEDAAIAEAKIHGYDVPSREKH